MPTYLRDTSTTAQVYKPPAGELAVFRQVITMATGDLDAADTFDICRLPYGAKVVDVFLVCTDMDTSGSPTLAFDVGDSGDTDRFIAAGAATAAVRINAAHSAATAASMAAHTAYTAETLVYGTVQAAAATKAAGTIVATVYYTVEA